MNALEKNLRFLTGTTIGNSKILFPINYYRKEYNDRIVHADSDCCIEGFQRSGNSFFVILFKNRNRTLKIAHHTHAAAQILRAIEYNIPTLVLIREPVEVIASLLAWDSSLLVGVALKAYISFYRKLLPYVDNFLVIGFEDVTTKPIDVVKAFNTRFGVNFILPEYTDARIDRIREGINNRNVATASPLPTPEKEKAKEGTRERIKDDPKLSDAIKIYGQFYTHRYKFEQD